MIIGIDIGTTHIKAAAIGEEGACMAMAQRTTQDLPTIAGRHEQDPEAIFQRVLEVLAEIQAQTSQQARPEAIAFSTALHSLLALDAEGNPLTNALLWSDTRAATIAEHLRQSEHGADLYRRSGVPVHPMSPLCKIIWLRENESEIFRKTHKFLGIKDYILYRLSGTFICDLSIASATGLMDLEMCQWNAAALDVAGIDARRLPELVSPYHQVFVASPDEFLNGWLAGVPLIAGAGDGCLANLGVGALEPGKAALTIGTSGAFRVGSRQALIDPEGRTFCYRLDENWFIAGGATNNGGNVMPWLSKTFTNQEDLVIMLQTAASVAAGSDGLIFLPYLHGERAPLWDARARGAFWGLRAEHTPAHFVRAGLEGILYNLEWISDLVQAGEPVKRLLATGGFTGSDLWLQMAADIFDVEVWVPESPVDASVIGAVLMARQALGQSVDLPKPEYRRFRPNPAHREVYGVGREWFRRLAMVKQP